MKRESARSAERTLADKIGSRTARLVVIGLGYVGLPLSVEFARAGFHVDGIDVDGEKAALVNQGRSYIPDIPDAVLAPLVEEGKLRASGDFPAVAKADAVHICVPTPLRKTRDPDISYILAAVDEIVPRLRRGALVVLESTTYPGTTEEVLLPALAAKGRRAGRDFFLAFSPERVDPGNSVYATKNTPKIVGGVTPACGRVAQLLYGAVIDRVVTVSSPRAAEMVKLLENTFRSVNIGLVNEIALICHRLGLSVWEVIDAAATKPFGFMPFYPGPGLGGHCIPVDPHYLSWKLKSMNFNARFIELAGEVNARMPEVVVERVAGALNERKKAVKGARIHLLGVAYKREVGDVRESPALDIMELLRARGAVVTYSDPFVPEVRLDGTRLRSRRATPVLLRRADAVVIVTDHAGFDYRRVVEEAALVFDTRNAVAGAGIPARGNVVLL